jgi:hypothetical protein
MTTRQATTDVSSQLVPPPGILCVIVDLLFTFLFFLPWDRTQEIARGPDTTLSPPD